MLTRLLSSLTKKIRPDADLKEIIRGGGISLVYRLAAMLGMYLFAIVVNHMLGVESWGIFSLSLTVIMFGGILGTFGLDTTMVKITASLRANERTEYIGGYYRKSLSIMLLAASAVTVAGWFLSPIVAERVFSKPHLAEYFQVAVFGILPVSFTNMNAACLRGWKKISYFALLTRGSRNTLPLLTFPAALLFGASPMTAVAAYVAAAWLNGILSAVLLLRTIPVFPMKADPESEHNLFALTLPLLFGQQLFYFKEHIDTIMLGIFVDEAILGIYDIALRLAVLGHVFIMAVDSIAAPKMAEEYGRRDMEGLQRIVAHATRLVFYLSAPLLLVIFLFPGLLLSLFGSEFQAGIDALRILLVARLIMAATGSVAHLLQMTGLQVWFQNITITALITGVILNYLLIPVYGINGTAISTFTVNTVFALTGLFVIKLKYNINTSIFYFKHPS